MAGRQVRSSRVIFGLVAMAITGTPPVGAQQPRSPALPEAISLPAELAVVLRAYEAAWEARDADALANLFAPDGFVMRPGYPPVRGRDAIRSAYASSGGPLSLRAYDYAVEGTVGFIIGGYSPSPDIPEGGKFILALKRDAAGAWLIAADMDNGN